MRELIETLSYIHKSGIIHRDMKPENVLVHYNKQTKNIDQIKVIDFGLSCFYLELEKNSAEIIRCGTLNYSAPEVINMSTTYDERSDIYSLGVILFYMLFKWIPFADENSQILR